MKIPSFQFYPGDWLNDIKLQSCSMESHGLLINLMCLMHQSDEYGCLLINGQEPSNTQITKLLRVHYKTFNGALNELLDYGVLRRDERGVIYCPRMVKDEEIRRSRREAGSKGGNPRLLNLVNQKDNQADKQEIEKRTKQKQTPSSSSSSSPSSSEIHKAVFDHWNAQKIIVHGKLTNKDVAAITKALKDYPLEKITKAISNYSTVIGAEDTYFKHKWTLQDFLGRGLGKFVDEADPINNYKTKRDPVKPKEASAFRYVPAEEFLGD